MMDGSGVAVKDDETPPNSRVEPGVGSAAPTPGNTTTTSTEGKKKKKKRGRPRKYAPPDGSIVALSPMPISASFPLTGAWKQSSTTPSKPLKKKHNLEFGSQGGLMALSISGSFIPHVITVNTGEDITTKIISLSQQGHRAICVLAANGSISNVTLRQSSSSGGTLTYEGNFEILSLMGSFMPNENGSTKSRTGGMSVSLAGSDGRVFGGGIAGMLVAAGSVQIVLGSFLPGHQPEPKPKKPKLVNNITYRSEPTFNGSNPNSIHGLKISDIDNNDSLIGEDSEEHSHELTC